MKSTTRNKNFAELLDQIRDIVDTCDSFLVASHIDPDGDALGTQLAFARYLESAGKTVFLVRDGEIPDKYRFLTGSANIPVSTDEYLESLSFEAAIVLECPDFRRIGRAAKKLGGATRIVNIDHHLDNALFGEVNWINSSASSVGEMVYEYFSAVGYQVDEVSAELLYTAIMTDTGRFRFDSTSARTMEIGGALISAGARPQLITDEVYYSLRPESMKLVGKILNDIEYHHHGRLCVLRMSTRMLAETGADMSDTEGVVDFTLFTRGVDAGLFLREMPDGGTKASLRSRDGINVAEIAKRYGGGGHFNASGCTLPKSLAEAGKELIAVFREVLNGS